MARSIHLWLPGLTALALFSACGGVNSDLFSASGGASSEAGSGNQDGRSSSAGATGSGETNAGGSAGAVDEEAGATSEGGSTAAGSGNAGAGGTAHAGATGSAGASAGGAAGHGGSTGSSAGSGGSPAGGSAGAVGSSGGSAGSGTELTCAELFALANQELDAARVCNLALDATQCTAKEATPCGCQVPVESADSAETKAYLATRKELEKRKCVQACPALACLPVTHAVCKASAASSTGVCTASYALPQ